jgi:hypothetical protein
MKFKKIVSKDKSYVSREENGTIWISNDNGRSFSSCGTIVHGACNVHKICSLDKKYDDYFPVQLKLLRFGKRFDIEKLRLVKVENTLEKYGWTQKQTYGYVPVNKFEYLMHKRKKKQVRDNQIVLLKEKDAVWKDL